MADENYMNQEPAGSPQVGNLTAAAGASGQVWEEAREGVRTLKQNTDQYVRKNPAKAVLTALAIGFVLGLVRRR
jgi:ElaB/YqjD/DUF883 family membrane-anchored ribosome-binding protein